MHTVFHGDAVDMKYQFDFPESDVIVARYVRVQLRKPDFLSLAEVEVYGRPVGGKVTRLQKLLVDKENNLSLRLSFFLLSLCPYCLLENLTIVHRSFGLSLCFFLLVCLSYAYSDRRLLLKR